MKKLEKEIEGSVFSTDILKNSKATTFKVRFGVGLNLTKDEFEIFEDSFGKGKIKIVCEVEEPILDDKEREYLRGVIKPFREKVVYIEKTMSWEGEYIDICLEDDTIAFPYFEKGTMYKGMKVDKKYSLKELGL